MLIERSQKLLPKIYRIEFNGLTIWSIVSAKQQQKHLIIRFNFPLTICFISLLLYVLISFLLNSEQINNNTFVFYSPSKKELQLLTYNTTTNTVKICQQLNKWQRGVVLITTVHFIKKSLYSGSKQVQILHAVCWKIAMVRISDDCPD